MASMKTMAVPEGGGGKKSGSKQTSMGPGAIKKKPAPSNNRPITRPGQSGSKGPIKKPAPSKGGGVGKTMAIPEGGGGKKKPAPTKGGIRRNTTAVGESGGVKRKPAPSKGGVVTAKKPTGAQRRKMAQAKKSVRKYQKSATSSMNRIGDGNTASSSAKKQRAGSSKAQRQGMRRMARSYRKATRVASRRASSRRTTRTTRRKK